MDEASETFQISRLMTHESNLFMASSIGANWAASKYSYGLYIIRSDPPNLVLYELIFKHFVKNRNVFAKKTI